MKKVWLFLKKWISTIAFVTGFFVDAFTLTRIDLLYSNLVFVFYLVIVLIGIFLVHAVETRLFAPRFLLRLRAFLPILIQFPIGGLFSGFLIFYVKSSSFFTSWPFVLILFTLFIGNEFFRKRYEKLIFQITLFYFALFTYLVMAVPMTLHTMGTSTFIFAGILSLFIIFIIQQILKKFFEKLYTQGAKIFWACIAFIYVGFHILYFTNSIPPIPLALKEIGVFHSVVRTEDGYRVKFERPAWYEFWRETSGIYHKNKNEVAYCFSSVFAPTHLQTEVYHSWQRRTADGKWIRESRIPFTIEGGRGGGYRGYTFKQNLDKGVWRCVVETENMQVIGETTFNVVEVNEVATYADEIR